MCSRSCGNGTVSPQAMHFSAGHSYGIIKIQCLLLYGECMGLGMQDCTDGTVTFMTPCMLTVTHNYHLFLPTSWESSSLYLLRELFSIPLERALLYTLEFPDYRNGLSHDHPIIEYLWVNPLWYLNGGADEPNMALLHAPRPQWRCWWACRSGMHCKSIAIGEGNTLQKKLLND